MESSAWYALGVVTVLALRELFWTFSIAACLWIARKLGITDKWGRRVFGRFWR
jgi:hypothetical protein